MLPEEEELDILTEFLVQFSFHKVKGIPMNHTNENEMINQYKNH
jgi:hypothetical protein